MIKQNQLKNKIAFAFTIFSLIVFCGCEGGPKEQQIGPGRGSSELEIQAAKIILQGLSSSYPQVRTNAIEIAAGTGKQQFMPEIQRLTKDGIVPVRFTAAVAIGESKYSPARNDVAQLLKDDDENVRLAADYALAMLGGSKSYIEQIRNTMSSNDQQVRANAAFLLGKIGDRKAIPLLHDAIRDEASDDKVRLNAVEALARLGDETIYQKLWALLISAYADDRIFGIRSMGALGTPAAKDSILTMLKDELPEVRLVAAEELGNLGNKAGEKVVIDTLTKGITVAQDQETRARIQTLASLAIAQIRTPALKKFLPELLKSDSQFAQLAAAKAVLLYQK